MRFKLAAIFLIQTSIWATIPTLEGLFRNPSSPELDKDLSVITFKMNISKKVEVLTEEVTSETLTSEAFYKYIFETAEGGKNQSILAKYDSRELDNNTIKHLEILENEQKILEEQDFLKKLIHSVFYMYGKNSSKVFSNILKEVSPDYMTNEELINKEKQELLGKYKDYLVQKKDYEEKMKALTESGAVETKTEEEGLIEEPKSPLQPEEEEEKEKVTKIISDSMYTKTNFVTLKKEGKKFFWSVDLTNVSGKFTNEEHQMKYLKLTKDQVDYEVFMNDYVTYSGQYLLPKMFKIKYKDTEIQVEVMNFYSIKSKKTTFDQRISDYKKIAEKAIKEVPPKTEKIELEESAKKDEQIQAKIEISDYFY